MDIMEIEEIEEKANNSKASEAIEPKEWISKTQRKLASKEINIFAKKLGMLTPKQIAKMSIDDELLEEISKVRKIKSHIARNRHVKYIGSLIRTSGSYDELLNQFNSMHL